MTTAASPKQRTSSLLSYFSLFTSLSTLLCCALPSLLVLAGLGASVGSMLSALPWLVALSKHKQWTFGISGALIVLNFLNMYVGASKLRGQACDPENSACLRSKQNEQSPLVVFWSDIRCRIFRGIRTRSDSDAA